MERILLAYSGGLDASIAIPWLIDQHGAEIVAVTLDVGQARELGRIRERALGAGAVRAHVLDVRHELATEHILPALQAGAIDERRNPFATELARPLIARKLIEVADLEQVDAIAHGGAGAGGVPSRLEIALQALKPAIRVIAPARVWNLSGPARIDYAVTRGIPVPPADAPDYRIDENLWGRSIAGGPLRDGWAEPPDEIYTLTKSPVEGREAAVVEIEFERGVPTAINGIPMPLVELIVSLETIAGAHGVGRIDAVDNRAIGRETRWIYEAPAAVVLNTAHRDLASLVTPPQIARRAEQAAATYADLVYDGLWFTPAREALDVFVADLQQRVTGAVRLKLWSGACRVVGRRSPFAPPQHTTSAADDHARSETMNRVPATS